MRSSTLINRMIIAMVLLMLPLAFTSIGVVFAAQAQPNGSTTVSFSANPVTLVAGDDLIISTLTISAAQPTQIDPGRIVVQLATDGLGNPVPSAAAVQWVALNAPGQNPVGGVTSLSLDLDTLGFVPGIVGGFRVHYVTGGGRNKVDTHFSAAIDLTVMINTCTGLNCAASLASGNGTPNPGYSGQWTFRILVTNCTGVDLNNIKVQGGTNGWAPMIGAVPSSGTYTVRENNRNQVLTWTVSIPNGGSATLDVTVQGTIPLSYPVSIDPMNPNPASIRYLSGNWSAASGSEKSPYSERVSIIVVPPTQ